MHKTYEELQVLIDSLAQYAGISHDVQLREVYLTNEQASTPIRSLVQVILESKQTSFEEVSARFEECITAIQDVNDVNLSTAAIIAFGNYVYKHREAVEAIRVLHRAATDESTWYPELRMAYFWRLGVMYQRVKLIHEASTALNKAHQLAGSLGRNTDLAVFKTELSTLALEEGDPARALTGFEEAYNHFVSVNSPTLANVTLLQIAGVNHRLGNVHEAISQYKLALKQQVIADNPRYRIAALLNLALAYSAIDEYDEAALIYSALIDEEVPASMHDLQGHAHVGMAQLLGKQEKWDESLRLYNKAMSIFSSAGHVHEQSDIAGNIADTLWKADRKDEALALLSETFMQMEDPARKDVALRLGQALEKMYVELDDHKNAYAVLTKCTDLRKSIYARESERAIELDRVRASMTAEREAIKRLEEERRKILYNVMPLHIADRLMDGEHHIAERLTFVGVMFADISGFTQYASTLSSEQVLRSIEQLFQAIDNIIIRNNCQRIKTIGDAYMASTGTSTDQQPECIVDLVRSAIEIVQLRADPELSMFSLRVGIHGGPAIAGVMKGMRLSYDMWGDTVNIASRMESLAEPNRILVSGTVADILMRATTIPVRGPNTMEVRGRGMMDTYWIET